MPSPSFGYGFGAWGPTRKVSSNGRRREIEALGNPRRASLLCFHFFFCDFLFEHRQSVSRTSHIVYFIHHTVHNMSKLLKLLVKRVESEIVRRNLSHRELAKISDISHSTVSKLLGGADDIRLSTIEALAKAFNTTSAELIKEEIAPNLEARVSALESKVSAKPSSLIERLSAVAAQAHEVDVENVIQLLEDLISHYDDGHNQGSAEGA